MKEAIGKEIEFDAIVVGAGHNGLSCAFYLAQAGLRTAVIERHSEVGGAAITEEFHPGFRNSVAAYTVSLLQPKVINDMRLEQHGLKVVLRKVDNFLPSKHGYLLAGRDGLTQREIARHSKKDARAYPQYQAALTRVVDLLREFLLVSPPNAGGGLADVLGMLKLGWSVKKLGLEHQRDLLDFFTKSAAEILDYYFENEHVKALFAFDAVVGNFASPRHPGSAYVLLHHVFGEAAGVREAWGHAIGGMGAITQSMRRACQEQGVTIITNEELKQIRSVSGAGFRCISKNREYRAKVVASSVHPTLLFEQLLSEENLDQELRNSIARYQSHSGTFRMNLALDRLPEFKQAPSNSDYLTSGIIIAPSMDYMHQAWISADQKGVSDKPIIEMLIPSTLDDSLAPKGRHVASLFCQHFAYSLPDGQTWEQNRERVADHIIETVDNYAPGFKDAVLARQCLSPLDLENRFGLIGGDIFHGRMSLDQLFSARPILGMSDYRGPVKGLYLCGSGTHPGGGVTGAPGHNAAQKIVKDKHWRA